MKHSVTTRKELTILKIEEEVFDFRHKTAFKAAIDLMVNTEHTKNLIVDFSQVKAIDSCGISSMLMAHQLANQSHGLAIFVALCKQIKDLLKLTNLDKQLYIFSSINEVMTLIEPAMKNKRQSRSKSVSPVDEIIDELLCTNIDLVVPPDLHDEHLAESLDEPLDESDNDNEENEDENEHIEKEANSKKRGRPNRSKKSVNS